jgi:hypothetical protein
MIAAMAAKGMWPMIGQQVSLICLGVADTLFDILRRDRVRTPVDRIPM